jgi:hypothetical protein
MSCADPAIRFLLNQAAQPCCDLEQVIIVAADRPVQQYMSWIGHQRLVNTPPGRISIVDCFSDPCAWKASWAARQPDHEASQRRGPEDTHTLVAAANDNVPVVKATRDERNSYQDISTAVRGLLKKHPQRESQEADSRAAGEGGEVGGKGKTLVVIDSASYLVLHSGVQDVLRMLYCLSALPSTCVAFVVHTGNVHVCMRL